MTDDPAQFADIWASENIYVEAYDPPRSVVRKFADELLKAAAAKGISKAELEQEIGDLEAFVADRFEETTDAEIERLASKDD